VSNKEIITKIFEKVTRSKLIHEAILFVENSKGEFSMDLGFGGKNADSPLFTASIGKLFTTTCILILENENKLSFDDTIDKYFDNEILNGLHIFNAIDYSRKLTISNLIFQTSGIPDWFEECDGRKKMLEGDQFISWKEKINGVKKKKPFFKPGTRTRYSDTNFVLLVKIIEKITGMPMTKVCNEWIFLPLGLSNTFLPTENDKVPNAYYKNRSMNLPKFMQSAAESGDAVTTARELMTFIKAFFNGKLFPKEMFSKLSKYGQLQITMSVIQYGGGYMRIPLNTITTLYMGKGELLGHSGATGSFAFYYPEKDLYFVGDVNQLSNPSIPIILVMKLAMKI